MKKFKNFINEQNNDFNIIKHNFTVISDQSKKFKQAKLSGGYDYKNLATLFTDDNTSNYIKKNILKTVQKNKSSINDWLNHEDYWKKADKNKAKQIIKQLQNEQHVFEQYKIETVNTANPGDYIVKAKTEAGEEYVIKQDKFPKLYKIESKREPSDPKIKELGFYEYDEKHEK